MNKTTNNQINVILYCRVSTDEQAEKGFSLNYQEESLKRHCAHNGYNVVKVFREDHSAKNFNRPKWNELKSFVKANKKSVNMVLFTKWDRFSRNVEQALKEIREFDSAGIEINSSEHYIDMANCDNKMVLTIYLTAGEVERDKISIRTAMGTYQAKCEGYYAHRAPFGYTSQREGNRIHRNGHQIKRTKLVPNENAHFVTEAFRAVSLGIEPAEVVRKRLNKQGMQLGKSSFNLMLKNILYAGKIEVHEFKNESAKLVDGVHTPLTDLETFLKVQDVFQNKKWKYLRKPEKEDDFPLRNFIVCECCGQNLTASYSKGRNERYGYYHGRHQCKTRIRKEKAENTVAQLLTELSINSNIKSLFVDILKDSANELNGNKANELKVKKTRLSEIQAQLTNADDMFLAGKMPSDRYNITVERYNAEKMQLELEIEVLTQISGDITESIETGLLFLENLDQMFFESDNEGKKMILGSLFTEKLVFGKEKCRTTEINEVIRILTRNDKGFESTDKKKAVKNDSFSVKVPGVGIEPTHLSTRV